MKNKNDSSLDKLKSELKTTDSSLTNKDLDKLKGGAGGDGHTYTYSKGNTEE